MRKGKLTSDYGEAVKSAASNSAGSMNGFMGIGMMNMASAGTMGNVAQGVWQDTTNQVPQQPVQQVNPQPQQPTATVAQTNADEWECPNCHTMAVGKFCPECGTKKPESKKKFCSNCGKELKDGAKFCPECGTKAE